MTVRISSNQIHESNVRYMNQAQSKVAELQSQLATGKRVLSPADDPAGSARLVELQRQIQSTEQYQTNISFAGGRLGAEEDALSQANDLMDRTRQLLVQANTTTLSNADRGSIAQEIRQIRGELLQLANGQDGNGEYLFGGYQTASTPFVEAPAGQVSYAGDSGQRLIGIAPTRSVAVSDAGDAVFMNIPTGNGIFSATAASTNTGSATLEPLAQTDPSVYQRHRFQIDFVSTDQYTITDLSAVPPLTGAALNLPNDGVIAFNGVTLQLDGAVSPGDRFTVEPAPKQDVFTTLDDIANALETPYASTEQLDAFHRQMDSAMDNIDRVKDRFLEVRTTIGARMNGLDAQESINSEFSLRMQEIAGGIEDVDYADATTKLNQYLLTLQAAQQSYAKISRLSLFDYLG